MTVWIVYGVSESCKELIKVCKDKNTAIEQLEEYESNDLLAMEYYVEEEDVL